MSEFYVYVSSLLPSELIATLALVAFLETFLFSAYLIRTDDFQLVHHADVGIESLFFALISAHYFIISADPGNLARGLRSPGFRSLFYC